MTTRTGLTTAMLFCAVLIACNHRNTDSDKPAVSDELAATEAARRLEGLRNVMRVSSDIYSGGEPSGELGFESLQHLGVKTVVSVDGIKPSVELARKHGLRYVHIPIGYDGIPPETGEMLARLVRDANAPFYIHCHHGNHRGPAAAAVACIASGECTGREALSILERGGTDRNYAGLWRDVENYAPPLRGAELPKLVESASVSSLTAAMAQIDRIHDNLKLCRDSDWGTPPEHPDIVPAQEALLMREGLREARRTLRTDHGREFSAWLAEAEENAAQLRKGLNDGNVAAASEQFRKLAQSCRRCHHEYRDH